MKRPSDKAIIKAIQGTGGIISAISKRLGCARSTVHVWINQSDNCKQALTDEIEKVTDMAEAGLIECIHNRESWAIKFYLSTKGANRGYIEKKDVQIDFNPITDILIEEKYTDWQDVTDANNKFIQEKPKGKE